MKQYEARMQALRARTAQTARKIDTRKKVLGGVVLLSALESEFTPAEIRNWLLDKILKVLPAERDRVLFADYFSQSDKDEPGKKVEEAQ